MTILNRQWRLASYPDGMPVEGNWSLAEAPYMRGRISPQKNYAAGVSPGDLMIGGGIGEVLRSNSREYKPGDIVVTDHSFGWQEHALVRPASCRRVEGQLAPLPYWLDALGMNGMTAYFALYDCAAARPGDTVFVSAAAGSVGQIAGQLAKVAGCRAVGITSSPRKAAWCREIGYDEVIDYRAETDLVAAVARACPRGVDVFIDNTAGPIHDAVVQNLATRARIAIVGAVSLAGSFGKPDIGPRFHRQLLIARATVRGFLVSDYQDRYPEARARMGAWVKSGGLRSKFDIAQGFEQMARAFLRLLKSENLGKQIVKVGDEP